MLQAIANHKTEYQQTKSSEKPSLTIDVLQQQMLNLFKHKQVEQNYETTCIVDEDAVRTYALMLS